MESSRTSSTENIFEGLIQRGVVPSYRARGTLYGAPKGRKFSCASTGMLRKFVAAIEYDFLKLVACFGRVQASINAKGFTEWVYCVGFEHFLAR